MPPLKNARHEKFIRNLFSGMTQTAAAVEAGYSVATADSQGNRLLKNARIIARLLELQKKAESAAIMTVTERKERLSEIARAKLVDFMELGQDGSWVNVGPESVGGAAIQEIHSRTEYDENGAHSTIHTSVKLHDPMRAIAELNKMEGAYAVVRAEVTGPDGKPIQHEVLMAQLTDQQLLEIITQKRGLRQLSSGKEKEG